MINMRNIALTFLGCFTILAACSNSDDAEKPVTPVPTGDVTIYATTNSLTRDLTRDAVNFSSKDNLAPTSITLDPTEQFQTMDGFGVAITGATCFNLEELPVKHWAMSMAQKHVLVVDHSKFGKVRPARMGDLKRFDIVVSDCCPEDEYVKYAQTQRIKLMY